MTAAPIWLAAAMTSLLVVEHGGWWTIAGPVACVACVAMALATTPEVDQ